MTVFILKLTAFVALYCDKPGNLVNAKLVNIFQMAMCAAGVVGGDLSRVGWILQIKRGLVEETMEKM